MEKLHKKSIINSSIKEENEKANQLEIEANEIQMTETDN